MKIGFTCSTFDLLHAGHVLMLAEAKDQCDHLIVGLQTDPTVSRPEKNKPVQSLVERYVQLIGCIYVDGIIAYTTEAELEELLTVLDFDVRILGKEYEDKEFTGKQICLDRGIELYFNSREHKYSSTELRQRVYNANR